MALPVDTDVTRMQPISPTATLTKPIRTRGMDHGNRTGSACLRFKLSAVTSLASSSGPLGQTSFYDARIHGDLGRRCVQQFQCRQRRRKTTSPREDGATSEQHPTVLESMEFLPGPVRMENLCTLFFSGTGNASSASSFTFLQGKNLDVFSYITATLTTAP